MFDTKLDRRNFIRTATLSTLGVWVGTAWRNTAWAETSANLDNGSFKAAFDVGHGTLSVWRADGSPFLTNVGSRLVGNSIRSTTQSRYHHSVTRIDSEMKLVMTSIDQKRELDFRVEVVLGTKEIYVQCFCTNVADSGHALRIASLETVRAVLDEGATCYWPSASKALTNGYMYYDPGSIEEFDWTRRKSIQSMWNLGLYRSDDSEGLTIGFLENGYADGRITAGTDHTVLLPGEDGGISLIAESLFNRAAEIPPGATVTAGQLVFQLGDDPFQALESYASGVGRKNGAKFNPGINGWTHWAYTKQFSTEKEVLANAEFAARQLKPYGLEYIQIDDGYPRAYGDWEGGAGFPSGMKSIAKRIRALGFKAGIWMCPFAIAEGTEVFRDHPEWLIRDLSGAIMQCGGGPEHAKAFDSPLFLPKIYGLDITHPGAADWLGKLFARYANDFGYDFFKIDFVEWTILRADRYHDPRYSKAAAYRKAFEVIRKAIGPTRHLLDCGPTANVAGLVDSTRINLDYPVLDEEQYFKNFNSNLSATAKRYYFHGRAWLNDDDQLGLAHLSPAQAQAAASVIALSGGNMISSDRLVDLDEGRLETLKKVFPLYGKAARPLDLFRADKPSVFSLPITTQNESWIVLGVFNPQPEATLDRRLKFGELGLDPQKSYLFHEFWSEKFLGEFRDLLPLRQDPGSVSLLSVRERSGVPQVLSTSRHFTQGAVELGRVAWNEAETRLQGVAQGAPGTSFRIHVFCPPEFGWAVDHRQLIYNYGSYSVKALAGPVLEVDVKFAAGVTAVEWTIPFVI